MRLKISDIGITHELLTPTRPLVLVEFMYGNMEELSKEHIYS